MRGYAVLHGDPWIAMGALTPEQATEMIFPKAQVRSGAGHDLGARNAILHSVTAGLMVNDQGVPAYIPGTSQCAASGQSSDVKLAQISGQMALTGVNIAAMASTSVAAAIGTALGPATLGISALIGLFPLLFGHHAAAVRQEQSVLCAAVPAANNYLQIIDQAVTTGKASPQQGIDALNSLVTDFHAKVQSIQHGSDPMSQGECNAACVMLSELRGIVALKASQYQDLAAAQPISAGSGPQTAPASSGGGVMTLPVLTTPTGTPGAFAPSIKPGTAVATPATVAATPTPNWLPIAALAIVGFLAVKVL